MAARNPLVIAGGQIEQLQSADTIPSAALPDIVAGATVGDATHIPIVTYDAKGRITGTSTAAVTAGVDEALAFFLSSS